jgi:hypothetical protein
MCLFVCLFVDLLATRKKRYPKHDVISYNFGEITLPGYWMATIKHTGLQSHL